MALGDVDPTSDSTTAIDGNGTPRTPRTPFLKEYEEK
jgi:hypothetical protein